MRQQVKRVTLTSADEWYEVEFTCKATSFYVINYSDDDIYVSFESGTPTDESFKIKTEMGEEVFISKRQVYAGANDKVYAVNKLYLKGVGEVEVQELDF